MLDDPTPQLKNRQESLVMKHFVDSFEASDADVLETLVTDGGEVAPEDVADEKGWHIKTIYRAVDRLEDLVEHHYGGLSLRSHHTPGR
jgi:predicted transcriptional regulator